MSGEDSARLRAGWLILAAAVIASVALISFLARNTTLQGDEWSYAYRVASEPLSTAVFNPPYGGYLIALPMLIYAALFHLFGLASYVPYRVVGLILLIVGDTLFYELARRRVGALAALPPAILLLFLGSGSEIVLLPVRMPSQVALVAGLGMLLALERRDRRGDVLACLLLFVALTSHPLGIAFAAAAIVALALRPAGERIRGWWIVIPSIALFALWWVTLHGSFPNSSNPSPGDVVSFTAKSFTAVCAAATGFFRLPWGGGADFINPLSAVVAVLVMAVIVARLATRRPVPATAWAAFAAFAVAVGAPTLGPGNSLFLLRQPDASRYLYPDVLLLFLVLAEMAAGVEWRGRKSMRVVVAGGALVFAISFASNVGLLIDRSHTYEDQSSVVKSKLAGAELAATKSAPYAPANLDKEQAGFLLAFFVTVPHALPPPALAAYYETSEQFGTPSYASEAIVDLDPSLRRIAQVQFASALRLNRSP